MSKAFRWHVWGYKVQKVDSKDPLAQWEVSNPSIKNLFKDVLDKTKGFKHQITVKVLLRKDKQIGDIEFVPVYFNSTTKTVINFKYDINKSFQDVLYKIENWINEGCSWTIESVDAEFVNVSIYSPLSGSTFI